MASNINISEGDTNFITVIAEAPKTVNIVSGQSTVVSVATQGPQGPPGLTADLSAYTLTSSFNNFTGSYRIDSASFDTRIKNVTFDTSSLVTTSSFNNFTSSYSTGSFTGSFNGNLLGTASWAAQSLTASYVNPLHQDVIITGSIFVTQSHISTVDYIDFTPLTIAGAPAHNQGRIHWSDDTKTLEIDTDKEGFMIEVGHQSVVRVYNDTGNNIGAGTVVYISGSQGNQPKIVTASYEGDPTSAATLGFAATLIQGSGGNKHGYVVTSGILKNVNTSQYSVGTQLYLSSSGQFTNAPPDAPRHEVRLGKVLVSNNTTGVIYVDIMNGYELDELHDLKTTTATNGDLLVRSSSLWINSKQLTGSYGLTGSLSFVSGGVTGSLLGTASWASNAVTANTAGTAGTAFNSNQIQVDIPEPDLNEFRPLLVPKEEGDGIHPYYSGLFETPITFNPSKNLIQFVADPNAGSPQAKMRIGEYGVQGSGDLVVYGSLFAEELNVLPTTLKFIDAIDTSSFNTLTSLKYESQRLILTSGSYSGSFIGNLTGTASYATRALTASYLDNYIPPFPYTGNAEITGSLTITQNLTVLGSSSIIYITSSQLDVGTNTISVNVAEPGLRFGGLVIYDSGSLSHQATASLFWDSLNNHWVYQNASGSTYSGGGLISGPKNFGALGSETYPTLNRIVKGEGGDHITDSNISDNGSVVSINSNTQVTGSLDVSGSVAVTGMVTASSGLRSQNVHIGDSGQNTSVFIGDTRNYGGHPNSVLVGKEITINYGSDYGNNTLIGYRSLNKTTQGHNHTVVGANALANVTATTYYITALGSQAGVNATTGAGASVIIGTFAGRQISGSANCTNLGSDNVLVGYDTKLLANGNTNSLILGTNAVGLGSNTTVIGNTSTTFGRWYGNLLLGTNTNSGFLLDVNGPSTSGSLRVSGSSVMTGSLNVVGSVSVRGSVSVTDTDGNLRTALSSYDNNEIAFVGSRWASSGGGLATLNGNALTLENQPGGGVLQGNQGITISNLNGNVPNSYITLTGVGSTVVDSNRTRDIVLLSMSSTIPSGSTNINYNVLRIAPSITYTNVGGTNTVRGIYYNPTLTGLTGSNIAFESTTGSVIFGGNAVVTVTGSLSIVSGSGATRLNVAETGRITIGQDSTVTTQTSAVITTNVTNGSIVLAPNGTGAIIADIPDGTTAGGNARGNNAVDLQIVRSAASQVAAGERSFIGGGFDNAANGYVSAIAGGASNSAGNRAFVGGGTSNSAGDNYAVVAGGGGNAIAAGGLYAAIVGGQSNTAPGQHSFVGGGQSNTATTQSAVVAGGTSNRASNIYATVGGGQLNTGSGQWSTVGGGSSNVASGQYSVVAGGRSNTAAGLDNAVGGGSSNNLTSDVSRCVIAGGSGNVMNTFGQDWASIGGGRSNIAAALYSSIPGGFQAITYLYGQHAYAAGVFAASSDAQTSTITLRNSTTSTGSIELFLDGSSRRATLNISSGPTEARIWNARVDLVAVVHTVGAGTVTLNDVFSGNYNCAIKRVSNTTSMVGSVVTVSELSDTSMSTSIVTIDADDTNEALRIRFTPPTTAAADTVIRVVATAYLTEVGR